jgi:hypothetical protein
MIGAASSFAPPSNERVVFSQESGANQYFKLVASGNVNNALLEALEEYVKREQKRVMAVPKAD